MMSWSWVGGFVQADGHVFTSKVGSRNRLFEVCQRLREPLDVMRDFFVGRFPQLSFSRVWGPGANGMYTLRVLGYSRLPVLRCVVPYLRGEKYLRALSRFDDLISPAPLDDDWLAGFFDGEGGAVSRMVLYGLFIGQKDRSVLEEIQVGFGGKVGEPRKDGVSVWSVTEKDEVLRLANALWQGSHHPKRRADLEALLTRLMVDKEGKLLGSS